MGLNNLKSFLKANKGYPFDTYALLSHFSPCHVFYSGLRQSCTQKAQIPVIGVREYLDVVDLDVSRIDFAWMILHLNKSELVYPAVKAYLWFDLFSLLAIM